MEMSLGSLWSVHIDTLDATSVQLFSQPDARLNSNRGRYETRLNTLYVTLVVQYFRGLQLILILKVTRIKSRLSI